MVVQIFNASTQEAEPGLQCKQQVLLTTEQSLQHVSIYKIMVLSEGKWRKF